VVVDPVVVRAGLAVTTTMARVGLPAVALAAVVA